VKSLDPRVKRLPEISVPEQEPSKSALDQFGTFEVFVKPKEGKPFQHEGSVHAPNLEMGYILAKETFTRRFSCSSLCVVATKEIIVSPITDGKQNIYDTLEKPNGGMGEKTSFEIYHLTKRGKQHVHVGSVEANSPLEAMYAGKGFVHSDQIIFNIWAIPTKTIRFTAPEDQNLWSTLPEKKFRDASDYKGGDKLSQIIEKLRQP
jgi:ring-1,2-phenylacetyl-CoA epoxidase subunit PaaB